MYDFFFFEFLVIVFFFFFSYTQIILCENIVIIIYLDERNNKNRNPYRILYKVLLGNSSTKTTVKCVSARALKINGIIHFFFI